MAILLLFAFLSGLVTIAAPCIWPLLPIVLSSSIAGNSHKRPLGVTIGILISFGILTLTISYLVSFFGFDPNILRTIAVVVLLFLGFTILFPPLTRIVEGIVSRFGGRFGRRPGEASGPEGFWSGLVTGLSLGIVWTPCAGPILAAIATLAATRAVNFQIVIVTIVYLIGVGIPLFIFAYAGQRIVNKSRVFNKYTGTIQKVFGVIMILTALLIAFNYDKLLQVKLLDAVPGYSQFITNLEGNDSVRKQLDAIAGKDKSNLVGKAFNSMPDNKQNNLFNADVKAPEFVGITKWLNTPDGKPVTLAELKGKVVLVDFWTYTCINCIRTLPHVTAWYDKYKDDGFVVVGVHTPEFEFEKNTANVENAIKQYGIKYPVAQDNDYATWNAYSNQYWPAEYLIDKDGNIRRFHFGEGDYDETEEAIQELLKEAGHKVGGGLSSMPDQTPSGQISPETYIGSARMQYYYPNGSIDNGSHNDLKLSSNIPINTFSLGGNWTVADEYSTTGKSAFLEYKFNADKVFLVMKPAGANGGKVRILIDGKVVGLTNAGKDVMNGFIPIVTDRLYELINLKGNPGEHILRIEFTPGIQVFAFTFG